MSQHANSWHLASNTFFVYSHINAIGQPTHYQNIVGGQYLAKLFAKVTAIIGSISGAYNADNPLLV